MLSTQLVPKAGEHGQVTIALSPRVRKMQLLLREAKHETNAKPMKLVRRGGKTGHQCKKKYSTNFTCVMGAMQLD